MKLSQLDAEVLGHVIYRIANAQLNTYPYPHFYVRDVFPSAFYGDLARRVAAETDYHEEPGRYHGRQFANENLSNEIDGLRGFASKSFMKAILQRFGPQLEAVHKRKDFRVYSDCRFIRDGQGYWIGPHTDARWKLVSLLFYLPIYHMYERHGTSIYTPNDPTFTCSGGPHHDFPGFTRIWTAPYAPNSLFAFLKTDKSFHGVPPIDQDFQRDVFLYNLYDAEIYEQTHKLASNATKDGEPAASTPET